MLLSAFSAASADILLEGGSMGAAEGQLSMAASLCHGEGEEKLALTWGHL
jgi:hypothetical protein